MKKVLVYGSKEFGKVVRDLVIQCGHEFIGFIDDFNTGEEILGRYEDIVKEYPPDAYEIVIAVGYNNLDARLEVYDRIIKDGYNSTRLVHPKAIFSDIKSIGSGSFVMAGAIIDVYAKIDELVVLWPGVVVNHDSMIGKNTFLSPNCTICGAATIGESCFIGAGAVVVDHMNVPPKSFIKAGQVYYQK